MCSAVSKLTSSPKRFFDTRTFGGIRIFFPGLEGFKHEWYWPRVGQFTDTIFSPQCWCNPNPGGHKNHIVLRLEVEYDFPDDQYERGRPTIRGGGSAPSGVEGVGGHSRPSAILDTKKTPQQN
jgi:hypothetical protein